MDITAVFGTAIGGSNPSGSTKTVETNACRLSITVFVPEGFERTEAGYPLKMGRRVRPVTT